MINAILKFLISLLESFLLIGSSKAAFFDAAAFVWTKKMEDNYLIIRDEFLALQSTQIPSFATLSPEQERINEKQDWKAFVLLAYGNWVDKNSKLCPQTTQLLKEIPAIKSAMFSVLAPGTVLIPHRGPYRGVLRYHLALMVPKQNAADCALIVDHQKISWQEGSAYVFDDGYEHEAYNRTSEPRVVLFIDFERPLLFPFNFLNRFLIFVISQTPFIKRIYRNAGD